MYSKTLTKWYYIIIYILLYLHNESGQNHLSSHLVSCQTSTLQKSIFSSPFERRWSLIDGGLMRIISLPVLCSPAGLLTVFDFFTVQGQESPSRSSHPEQTTAASWPINSQSLMSSCPPPRRRRGRHPWWTQRWPSGWMTQTDACGCNSLCSGASWDAQKETKRQRDTHTI